MAIKVKQTIDLQTQISELFEQTINEDEYANSHFLQVVTGALFDYYDIDVELTTDHTGVCQRALASSIMDILKNKAIEDHEYINPHFLLLITSALYDYHELEDDVVDIWTQDMFGA